MELTLEISSLTYRYDRKLVLDGIDFSVNEGEVIGILGPNGCGKTTLLKNLNKNLSPCGGCVYLDGDDLKDVLLVYSYFPLFCRMLELTMIPFCVSKIPTVVLKHFDYFFNLFSLHGLLLNNN